MELKPPYSLARFVAVSILIVPDGIETLFEYELVFESVILIVPDGIETRVKRIKVAITIYILIVPDGIETIQDADFDIDKDDFNRTRWNWN